MVTADSFVPLGKRKFFRDVARGVHNKMGKSCLDKTASDKTATPKRATPKQQLPKQQPDRIATATKQLELKQQLPKQRLEIIF